MEFYIINHNPLQQMNLDIAGLNPRILTSDY